MPKLNAGTEFPKFEVETVNHGRLSVPDGLKCRYKVLLYYRGWW